MNAYKVKYKQLDDACYMIFIDLKRNQTKDGVVVFVVLCK